MLKRAPCRFPGLITAHTHSPMKARKLFTLLGVKSLFQPPRLFTLMSIPGKQPPHPPLSGYLNPTPRPTLSIILSSDRCLLRENFFTLYSLLLLILLCQTLWHSMMSWLCAKNCNRIRGSMVRKTNCVPTLLELTVWWRTQTQAIANGIQLKTTWNDFPRRSIGCLGNLQDVFPDK